MSVKKINLSALKQTTNIENSEVDNEEKIESNVSTSFVEKNNNHYKVRVSLKSIYSHQEKSKNGVISGVKKTEIKAKKHEIEDGYAKNLERQEIKDGEKDLIQKENTPKITLNKTREPLKISLEKKNEKTPEIKQEKKDSIKIEMNKKEINPINIKSEEEKTLLFQISDGDTNLTLVQEKKSEIFGRYAGSYTAAKEIKAEKLQEVLEKKEVIKKKKEKNIVKTEKTTKKDKKISKKFLLTGGTGVIAIVSIGFFWILGGGNIYSNILQSSHTADENISLVEDTQILEETSGDLDEINDNDNSDVVNIIEEQDIDLDAKKIILEKKIYDHFIHKSK